MSETGPKPLNVRVTDYLRQMLPAAPAPGSNDHLNNVFRLLGRWRQALIIDAYLKRHGARIWSGIFEGMDYVEYATEGALLPRLLGTYESELHPFLKAFADQAPECVIDVGCAEGYYAVGLARLMPEATVYAYDIKAEACEACTALAAKNGVSARVQVGGEFQPQDFQAFAGRKTLVMVDTEGAEVDILQPDLAPALAGMNIVVETHDVYREGAMQTLVERFRSTHDIVRVTQQPKAFPPPPWFQELPHLDQLICVWEWRVRPTPWLVMSPKPA